MTTRRLLGALVILLGGILVAVCPADRSRLRRGAAQPRA